MLRMVIVEGSEVGVHSDENWTTGLSWGKQLTAPDFRRNGRDQRQRNEIPCQSAVRGLILGNRQHYISRSKNSKHGFRRGKRFQTPEFRRKAGDQLQATKYHVNQWCEEWYLEFQNIVILLMKIRSGFVWIWEWLMCKVRNRNGNKRARTRYISKHFTWPLQELQNTSKCGSESSDHWHGQFVAGMTI